MSKALADKPGKNDPRRTPAPKRIRKRDQKKTSLIAQKTIRVKLPLMKALQKGYRKK